MAFARTQKGAQQRVKMKRAIRRAGGKISSSDTTAQIKKKYRKYVKK